MSTTTSDRPLAPTPPHETLLLSVDGVSVSFAGVQALHEVTMSVAERELLGLIGPNGAGKTTLVNVISGFQRPDRGTVRLGGREITAESAVKRGRRGLARTFQGVRLFGKLSVEENIEVSALLHGGSRRRARKRAREGLELLGLSNVAQRPAEELPYGEQRRVAIARCLAMEPKLLLMDEPAAGLNEEETSELGDAIEQIRRDYGTAIVLVEHDVALVMRLSDRIVVLSEGEVLATGTPSAVRENPHVVAAYLGVDDADG